MRCARQRESGDDVNEIIRNKKIDCSMCRIDMSLTNLCMASDLNVMKETPTRFVSYMTIQRVLYVDFMPQAKLYVQTYRCISPWPRKRILNDIQMVCLTFPIRFVCLFFCEKGCQESKCVVLVGYDSGFVVVVRVVGDSETKRFRRAEVMVITSQLIFLSPMQFHILYLDARTLPYHYVYSNAQTFDQFVYSFLFRTCCYTLSRNIGTIEEDHQFQDLSTELGRVS